MQSTALLAVAAQTPVLPPRRGRYRADRPISARRAPTVTCFDCQWLDRQVMWWAQRNDDAAFQAYLSLLTRHYTATHQEGN